MTYTPEELREAILIAVSLGLIIGGCLGFIWAAWVIEAKSTGRIDPRQAASILGKRGRAKQLRTQAEKQEAMTVALKQEGGGKYNKMLYPYNQLNPYPFWPPPPKIGREK